jgi:predicted anti-sigma-YlaC factor YlaD
VDLIECARGRQQPHAALRRHLRDCPGCRERWDDEHALDSQFRLMREAVRAQRNSPERFDQILRVYGVSRWSRKRTWVKWLTSAAAMVLVVAAGLLAFRARGPATASPPEAQFADIGDFTPVPYAPPLARGEFLQVVRTELRPIALARMGIEVDASSEADVVADLVIGEDGFPRAVHVVEESQF